MKAVRDKIVVHISPALELGSGRTKRANKLQVLAHSLMLLSPRYRDIPTLSKAMASSCSDFGVEAGVLRIKPVHVGELFPYLNLKDDVQEELPRAPDECDFEFENQPPGLVDMPDPLPPLDFTKCTEIPGLLHIVHNAGRGLESKLKHYNDSYLRLQKVAAC